MAQSRSLTTSCASASVTYPRAVRSRSDLNPNAVSRISSRLSLTGARSGWATRIAPPLYIALEPNAWLHVLFEDFFREIRCPRRDVGLLQSQWLMHLPELRLRGSYASRLRSNHDRKFQSCDRPNLLPIAPFPRKCGHQTSPWCPMHFWRCCARTTSCHLEGLDQGWITDVGVYWLFAAANTRPFRKLELRLQCPWAPSRPL